MVCIVNLSTLVDYSIDETIEAFKKLVDLDTQDSCLPTCVQSLFNYAWVVILYKWYESSIIDPYKLGVDPKSGSLVDTKQFLDALSILFPVNQSDPERKLLVNAWNASIAIPPHKQDRFEMLMEVAKEEPVILISNTNPLNVAAIMDLLAKQNSREFSNLDKVFANDKEYISIAPNISLCLSYKFNTFKNNTQTTPGLINMISDEHQGEPLRLISQFPGDLDTAKIMGISIQDAENFYNPSEQARLIF